MRLWSRERDFIDLFLQSGTLAWPNGFDLDSIALYDEMKAAGLLAPQAA